MKIAVIGAGAMGTLFGGKLAMTGNEVTMVDVVPVVLDTINKDGIELEDESGMHKIPVRAIKSEDAKEAVDLAILFTKTLYSRSALENAVKTLIGKDTYVLTLQNGLGNIELINEFVDLEQILVGVTNYASDVKGPGKISTGGGQGSYVKIYTASLKESAMLQKTHEALVEAGFHASITKDVYVAIWEKVGFNAAINATTAIVHAPCGAIGAVEEGRFLAAKIAEETAMVGQAHGVNVKAEDIIHSLENTYEVHKDHYTSMAQDLKNKRKTEARFINGGIVAKAKEKGLQVPYTEAVYCLLRTIEETYEMQGF